MFSLPYTYGIIKAISHVAIGIIWQYSTSQCGLAQFHFDEIGMFFVHSENPKLLGVTVKDPDTVGYTFFLYKCSVENYECEVSCENLVA